MIDGVSGGELPKYRELELGDRVNFAGMIGTVIKVEHDVWHGWPVTVKFDSHREIIFTLDGKMYDDQTEPCLKVIGKVKTKVKRWQFLRRSIFNGHYYATNHMTDEEVSLRYEDTEIKKIFESETEHDD